MTFSHSLNLSSGTIDVDQPIFICFRRQWQTIKAAVGPFLFMHFGFTNALLHSNEKDGGRSGIKDRINENVQEHRDKVCLCVCV